MTKMKRLYWGKENLTLPPLDLTWVQRESYEQFLQKDLQKYLAEISPIEDFTGKTWEMSFGAHYFEAPKIHPEEAVKKGLTYDMPLRVKVKLVNKITGDETEQDVFLGDIPKMTERGTFIVSGIERAVVNQLVRAPGAFFAGSIDPTTGRVLYGAELRPMRGSWLEMTVGKKDVITAKIDRHRKFYVTTLLRALGIEDEEEIKALFREVDSDNEHQYIFATLAKDPNHTQSEALLDLYDKIRPGEPAVLENAKNLFFQSFFDPRRYDLDKVGRHKINKKLGLEVENIPQNQVLQKSDIVAIVKYLIGLQNGIGQIDDIDHLGNRRVRRVGELLGSTAFRIGLLRLERSIKEKMSLVKPDESITPVQLINARPVIATISEFFRRNRLSTILDQTNPLSEIDNLRRLSVMGSGGVTHQRASVSIRDINSSQYGRICAVRSPEGPNIGLVTYLALYARVNRYGFIEAPFRKVVKEAKKIKVTDDIVFLDANDEYSHHVTHLGVDIDKNNFITQKWSPMRFQGEYIEGPSDLIEYIDVVPNQIVGTSASLIPFIDHDDATRALMGSHMQTQAVPLVSPQTPIVGTGMESVVAQAMNRTTQAIRAGKVSFVDATKVIITPTKAKNSKDVDEYILNKFDRTSPYGTCYNQRPIVNIGDTVKVGDPIIDGPATSQGELSI